MLRLLARACVLLVLPTWGWCATWHDPASEYRRPIQLSLEDAKISGDELANVRFLANGKQKPDGADLHITTLTGKPVPFRVVYAGPGDWMEVIFNTQKSTRNYYAYFDSNKPQEPSTSLNRGGLFLEIKNLTGDLPNSLQDFEPLFSKGSRVLGRRMIQRPFLGINPFGQPGWPMISKLSGRLYAPLEGNYTFAVGANDRGGLFIDGKPVVMSRHPVGDTRFQDRLRLDRGWHEFVFYQAGGGEYAFSVAWKRPDTDKFEVINREFFGVTALASAGPLEQQNKPITADLETSYLGESFFAWNYAHHYKFDLSTSIHQPEHIQCSWDFGDGQTATGRSVEHVFVSPSTYNVTLTVKLGGQSDTQTFRLPVDRDWEHADRPATDNLGLVSRMVAQYDLARLPPDQLAWATILHLRAEDFDSALAAGKALAANRKHGSTVTARKALDELIDEATRRNATRRLREVFTAVPQESDLNPVAASEYAGILMYRDADFPAALKAIEPFAKRDDAARRTYAQALILNGQLEEGRKVLEALPVAAARQKAPAISGALARTTEFYAEEKDAEHGEEAWDKWMAAFPAEFLEGNSVLLRVRLMQLRKLDGAAARLAEAFANANPQSAYASRLLNTASKLLATSDPAKSAALKELLRQRYPEDPLSQ